MKRRTSTRRAELYERILTADPPLCARGNPVSILNSCERRRQMRECLCRFDANEIAEDAITIGCEAIPAAFEVALEPDDVEAVVAELELCLSRPVPTDDDERDAFQRLERALARLRRVVDAEAGLTDEYSDAVDP